MKALNSDAQRILTESSDLLSDSKQAKLKDTLQKCNDHYIKLNKKLRDRVSSFYLVVIERLVVSLSPFFFTMDWRFYQLFRNVRRKLPSHAYVEN